jgi:hypothetical protein
MSERPRLLERIERRYPDLDLGDHVTKWAEVEDGSPALMFLDGRMFSMHGIDLSRAPT